MQKGLLYSQILTIVCLLCPFLSRAKRAIPTHRHNELRDITATVLAEVCSDVSIEPVLQPCNGLVTKHATAITDVSARADISVRGFWGSNHDHQSTHLDVNLIPTACFRHR